MIWRLPFAEEVAAVRKLLATLQRTKNLSKPVLQAVQTADKAARAVEQALAPATKLQGAVRDARRMRDTVGQAWESALANLRRDCRSAAEEGAPHLLPALFPPVVRATAKKTEPAETAPAVETPTVPAAEAPTAAA